MLALVYTYGFRKAELLSMKVRNVDLLGGTVGIDTSSDGRDAPATRGLHRRQRAG
jgi:integrase